MNFGNLGYLFRETIKKCCFLVYPMFFIENLTGISMMEKRGKDYLTTVK
jgi:hypothetical protein